MKVSEVLSFFKDVIAHHPDYTGVCPACDGVFSLHVNEDGRRDISCSNGCDPGNILSAAGLTAFAMMEHISPSLVTYETPELQKMQPVVLPSQTKRAYEIAQAVEQLHAENEERYSWSDMGGGYLFADVFKNEARYVPERKKWYTYDGIRWVQDLDGLQVMGLAKELADALVLYALTIGDERRQSDFLNYARSWRKRTRRETIVRDAASVHPISVSAFDANPFIFNCLNGTLDLRTGTFRDHDPNDLLSCVSGVQYDPSAQCERWEQFIVEVMQGDADKAAFLQKALGYALTGDTRYECFFVLYGPKSRNGKGTTMETIMRLMGDYGKSAKPDTIAQKQNANGGGTSEDIARLAGARFVNISEPDQRLVLSAATVKTMTGNDTITARNLYENSFEYRPQFKLFVNTNYLPKVTDVTLFGSGRVKVIPFERHFEPNEQDRGLKNELSQPENLSAIFNWCVAGLRAIERDGFDTPESVRHATDAYRTDSDKLGRFMAEVMIEEAGGEAKLTDIYREFVHWCDENGFKAENANNFKKMIENTAEVKYKRAMGSGRTSSPASYVIGYQLRRDTFAPTDEPTPWSRADAFSNIQ